MIVVAERDSWDVDFHQSQAGPVFYPTRTAVTSTVDFTFLGFICSALISSKMDIFLYQQMESVDFFNREYFILHVTLGLICQCLRSHRKWTLFQDRGKWGPHFSTHVDVIMDFSTSDFDIFYTIGILYCAFSDSVILIYIFEPVDSRGVRI